jgi:beta propeller repeat protein
MKKLVLGLIVSTIFILAGCQTGVIPVSSPAPSTTSEPAGSWQVGQNLNYSQEPIWDNTLVGLELNLTDPDVKAGQVPQSIVIYDLNTKERKRVIEPPEGLMVDTPSIYENKVVFAAVNRDEYIRHMLSSKLEPEPNYDIFLFDLETDQMQQLTTEEHAQMSPRIYGDTVIWLDARNQPLDQYPPPFDVYALDLKTNQETRITANATAEGYTQLAISGNLIVWTDMRYADGSITSHPSNASDYNNEIYIYDLTTNQERRLTTSPDNDRCPDIDGKRVIWLRQEDYQKADVFMYDLQSGQETQISHSNYADSNPSIFGDRIVWTDASSSKGNTSNDVIINGIPGSSTIVLFDIKAQKETQLTPTEAGKVWLLPVIHGNHIIYIWSRQIGGIAYALNLPPPQSELAIPASPWPGVKAYIDPSQTITIEVNEQFVIGYDIRGDLFPIFKETFDENIVTLVDEKHISYEIKFPEDSHVTWYLFKALKSGKIQIVIQYFSHLEGPLESENLFNVVIE